MDANSWSDLNGDILDCIIHKLDFIDFFRFSATCRSWHSSAKIHSNHCSMCPKALTPWFLFSYIDDMDKKIKPHLSFYDFASTKHNIHVASILSNIIAVIGSSNGFLVVTDSAYDIHIINPISRAHYPLPRVEYFNHPNCDPEFSCYKAVINICPTTNLTYSVAVLYESMILFVNSGDTAWTELSHTGIYEDGNDSDDDIDYLHDAIFYKGVLHLMCQSGTYVIDLKTHFETPTNLHFDRREDPWNYLVKSPNDELFLVIMHIVYRLQDDGAYYVTTRFDVYKFDDTRVRWDAVNDLGEYALFVGHNAFFFLPNTNCSTNVTKNNICFMDYGDVSVGVFDLVDGSVKLFELEIDFQWNDSWEALWFTPALV